MPNLEGQTYLKNAVKDLLDRFALEYVLAELRDQVRYASVNPHAPGRRHRPST